MIDDRNETLSSYEIMDVGVSGIVKGMSRLGNGIWEGIQQMITLHLHELKTSLAYHQPSLMLANWISFGMRTFSLQLD